MLQLTPVLPENVRRSLERQARFVRSLGLGDDDFAVVADAEPPAGARIVLAYPRYREDPVFNAILTVRRGSGDISTELELRHGEDLLGALAADPTAHARIDAMRDGTLPEAVAMLGLDPAAHVMPHRGGSQPGLYAASEGRVHHVFLIEQRGQVEPLARSATPGGAAMALMLTVRAEELDIVRRVVAFEPA